MTDYKQLCAELLRELDHASAWDYQQALKDQARAALAEPEPEEASDQKLHGYWISTSPSGQLTRQQIDAFLDRHKDPEDARRFLQEAGLIDQYGELARPYHQEQS